MAIVVGVMATRSLLVIKKKKKEGFFKMEDSTSVGHSGRYCW